MRPEGIERLRSGGGKDITEEAIMRGLNWLKTLRMRTVVENKDKDDSGNLVRNASQNYRNAMSGMALLAYLGHCELQDSPTFGPTVQKGIDFLTSTPPDEVVHNGNKGVLCPSIRTYALCEAYTMTKIPKLKEYAKRAAEVIIKGQNESGGWAYGYGKGPVAHTDLSVTGWNIQALKAAALTGISIDGLDASMDKATAYTARGARMLPENLPTRKAQAVSLVSRVRVSYVFKFGRMPVPKKLK